MGDNVLNVGTLTGCQIQQGTNDSEQTLTDAGGRDLMTGICGMQFYESRGAAWQPLLCVEPPSHAGPHRLVKDGPPLEWLPPPKGRATLLVMAFSDRLPLTVQEAVEAIE